MIDTTKLNLKSPATAGITPKDPFERLPGVNVNVNTPQGTVPEFDSSGLGGMPPGFFPAEYGAAADFYSNLMGGGMNMGMPSYWGVGGDVLTQMAQSGMPVDIQAYAKSLEPVTARRQQEGWDQIAEQMGMGGKRFSTAAQYQMGDLSSRLNENMQMATQQQWLQAQEAARQRQLGATGQLYNYGQGQANIGQQNIANQMAGAQGTMDIGREYMYGPMQIAQGLMGMGGQYQGAQGMAMDDPYLQMAMQLSGQMNPQYMQTQYQPGLGSNLMNLGGMGMNIMDMLGMGGGGMPITNVPGANLIGSQVSNILNQAQNTLGSSYFDG